MAEEFEPGGSDRAGAADPSAAALALNGASREEADTFLRQQSALARLQIAELRREDRVRHWSLRIRHTSDVLKLAFQLSLAFIGLAVALALGALIWNAAADDSLVIESFSVPPDLAQRGLTGQTVAALMLDKLRAMQAMTFEGSSVLGVRARSSFKNDWSDSAKIEIPEVGISIDQLQRFLRTSLGHETVISGELFRSQGGITVNARAGSAIGESVEGSEDQLDGVLQRSVERIYSQLEPDNYLAYLVAHHRATEASAFAEDLALHADYSERAWALVAIAQMHVSNGDIAGGAAAARTAISINPALTYAWFELGMGERHAGHIEAAVAALRQTSALLAKGAPELNETARRGFAINAAGAVFTELGDYAGLHDVVNGAVKEGNNLLPTPPLISVGALPYLAEHDIATASRLLASAPRDTQALAPPGVNPLYILTTNAQLRMALDDWHGAIVQLEDLDAAVMAGRDPTEMLLRNTVVWPWLAYAEVRSGDLAGGHALIARAPSDCYFCVTIRARIAAFENDTPSATRWFAEAVRQAPSIPMAYNYWGEMLLHRGDVDSAIAKFTLANRTGPHFADPLESWAEALMLENRSDLALVKFEDADKYAPNWGRLHMKWGEALGYAGRKDEAVVQYRIASGLYLSAADKGELAKDMR